MTNIEIHNKIEANNKKLQEAFSVYWRDAVLAHCVHMILGRVTLMLGDAVLRVGLVHILTHTVSRDLGQDGGGGNGSALGKI